MLVEAGVERQLGHADDPVHRGTDLVAHVGQEFALRAAGFHRLVARPGQVVVGAAQLGRPIVDQALEAGVLLLQLRVTPLNLDQHAVEAADELADLVVAAAFGPHVVAAGAGDLPGDLGQTQQWLGDDPLQQVGEQRSQHEGGKADDGDDPAEAEGAGPDFAVADFDEDGADRLPLEHERPDDEQAAGNEAFGSTAAADHRCLRLGRQAVGWRAAVGVGPGEAGEGLAVRSEDRRRLDLVVGRGEGEHFGGDVGVVERQRRRAGERQAFGEDAGFAHEAVP